MGLSTLPHSESHFVLPIVPFKSVGQILSFPSSCGVEFQPLNSPTDLNGTYSHDQPLVRMEGEADII